FQAEDGIRDFHVTGVQTCALPISKDFPVGYRVMTYMTAPMHVMRCLSQLRKLPTFILLPTMFRLCRQVHQVRTRSAIPLKIATMRTINNQPATQSVANSGNGGRWCN